MNRSLPKWAPYLLSALRIAAGLLFIQHGGEKLWGFAGGRIDHNFPNLHALAGKGLQPGSELGPGVVTRHRLSRDQIYNESVR